MKNRHVIITGASKGIGLAIAKSLAQSKHRLSLIARSKESLKEAKNLLSNDYKADVEIFPADLSIPKQIDEVLDLITKSRGPAEILINNVGIAGSAPIEKTDLEMFNHLMNINLTSTFLSTKYVLPEMRKANFGRIVCIASVAGLSGYPYVSAYCAAKHGVIGLVRSIAKEVEKDGITINALCPGFTETEMLRNSIKFTASKTGKSEKEIESTYLKDLPSGRFVKPEEIAAAAVWLCQDAQSKVNGEAIEIMGGESFK